MNNRGSVRFVFTSSNTSQGYYTFIPELINGLSKVFILKGAPGSGKSTFIRLLGEMLAEQGYDIEFWISAVEAVTPEGVFIPQLDAAVINGSLPQPIDPKYPGARHRMINLEDYWDKEIIEKHSRTITDLVDKADNSNNKAFSLLKDASRVKETIRNINSPHLNMEKIGQLIKKLSAEIMENRPGEKHYFAGAITPDGLVNYLDEISSDCKKRYVFKGPSGSGKSTVLNELSREAKSRGYFLEYYHCGLEVEYLSMVIIRNLQMALIEVGNGEISPKPWDVIIDMTEYMDNYDSNQVAAQASEAYRAFESLLFEAQQELENSNNTNKEIEKLFSSAMDFERLDAKRQEVADGLQRR